MKPAQYWEKKRREVLAKLARLERGTSIQGPIWLPARTMRCHQPPPLKQRGRKHHHALWKAQYGRWRANERDLVQRRRQREKLVRVLAYIEERLAVLTPTFWATLLRVD
jgi:hypothetical protein